MVNLNPVSVKYPQEKMDSDHILEKIRLNYTKLTRAQWIANCYFSTTSYFRMIGDETRPFSVSALQLAGMSRATKLTVFELMELLQIDTSDLPRVSTRKKRESKEKQLIAA
jgi:hypothetical protein